MAGILNLNGEENFSYKIYECQTSYNTILIPSSDIKSCIPNVHQQFKKRCHCVGQVTLSLRNNPVPILGVNS